MNTSVPYYLKLHRGEEVSSVDGLTLVDPIEHFWEIYASATGWQLQPGQSPDTLAIEPVQRAGACEQETESSDAPSPSSISENDAFELAATVMQLIQDIRSLEKTVRRQEIELASHASSQIGLSRAESTAQLVESTLQRAIDATGFNAAAVYILDEETQYLNTRAVVGLPADRLTAEPRTLRGSRGDLEAMVQEAVLIDDLTGLMGETWNAPETAGAAICTALLRADVPIGTIWLYADSPRELGKSHSSIAKMASEQLSLLFAEAVRCRREEAQRKTANAVRDLAALQYASLPAGNQIALDWFADGMIESPNDWATGWHVWDILPDGSLMLAIAQAEQADAGGAVIAATTRAALAAHSGYRHTPKQLLQRVSDTLWQTNTADQLTSMLYARIDPETGEGEVAAAGSINAIISSRFGYRPLVSASTAPLGSSIDVDCQIATIHLSEGETLMAYSAGLHHDGIGQDLLGCCLRTAIQSNANPLVVARREMAEFPNRHERGLLTLSRFKRKDSEP